MPRKKNSLIKMFLWEFSGHRHNTVIGREIYSRPLEWYFLIQQTKTLHFIDSIAVLERITGRSDLHLLPEKIQTMKNMWLHRIIINFFYRRIMPKFKSHEERFFYQRTTEVIELIQPPAEKIYEQTALTCEYARDIHVTISRISRNQLQSRRMSRYLYSYDCDHYRTFKPPLVPPFEKLSEMCNSCAFHPCTVKLPVCILNIRKIMHQNHIGVNEVSIEIAKNRGIFL